MVPVGGEEMVTVAGAITGSAFVQWLGQGNNT